MGKVPPEQEGWMPEGSSYALYFAEMNKYPLLSAQEERELKRAVDEGNEAGERLSLLGDGPGAAECRGKVEAGKRARERMILCNLRLVVSIAGHYRGCGVPYLDLIQEGNVGLMDAVDRFDAGRGTRFSTYAAWRIGQRMQRSIQNTARAVRLPIHLGDDVLKYRKARSELEEETGRAPTEKEISERSGLGMGEVRKAGFYSADAVSINAAVGDPGDGEEFGSLLADEAQDVEKAVADGMLAGYIDKAMESLDEKERQIVVLRYGLHGERARTLDEVGKIFGISRERVRQLEQKSLDKMRRFSSRRLLADLI